MLFDRRDKIQKGMLRSLGLPQGEIKNLDPYERVHFLTATFEFNG